MTGAILLVLYVIFGWDRCERVHGKRERERASGARKSDPSDLTPEESGQRLDQYLAGAVEGLTGSGAQKLLEEGRAAVNGKPAKKKRPAHPGDTVTVELPDQAGGRDAPGHPLDVVYEDADVIVVNKPVGMVVRPAPGHPDGTLVNAPALRLRRLLSGINGALRPWIVHRIDRDTSGLLIVAKTTPPTWPCPPSCRTTPGPDL